MVHLTSDDFDLATVLRAAETLGAERDPAGVVARLMEMVVASAGAERGVLLLAHDEVWEIAARHGTDASDVGSRVALDGVTGASAGALRYVARTEACTIIITRPALTPWPDTSPTRTHR